MDSCLARDQKAAVINKIVKSIVQRKKELLAGYIVTIFSNRTSVHAVKDLKNCFFCSDFHYLFTYLDCTILKN